MQLKRFEMSNEKERHAALLFTRLYREHFGKFFNLPFQIVKIAAV